MRCRSGRVRCRTSVSGPRECRGDGCATSHDIATSHLQHRVRHRTRPVRCRYFAPEPEATERHRRLPGRHRHIARETRAPTGGGHRGFFSDRSATPHEQRRERHRVRPGRCRYIAPGRWCDVAMSPRAGAMSHGRLGPVRMSRGWVRHIARHRNIARQRRVRCRTWPLRCRMRRRRESHATSHPRRTTSPHRKTACRIILCYYYYYYHY